MAKVKLASRLWARISAFILFCIAVSVAIGCGAGIYYSAQMNLYSADVRSTIRYADTSICRTDALSNLFGIEDTLGYTKPDELVQNTQEAAFTYVIRDTSGTALANSTDSSSQLVISNYEVTGTYNGSAGTYDYDYFVDVYVQVPVPASSRYYQAYSIFRFLRTNCLSFMWYGALTLLLSIGLLAFEITGAGRGSDGKVRLRGLNRLYLDLYLLLTGAAGVAAYRIIHDALFYISTTTMIAGIGILSLLYAALFLGVCMTVSVRAKAGDMWRHTAVYQLSILFGRLVGRIFRAMPVIWRTALSFLIFILLNFVCIAVSFDRRLPLVFACICFLDIVVFIYLITLAAQLKRVKSALSAVAGGDLSYRVDTEALYLDLKDMGQSINSVSAGMSRALEERMRSERFKTELITNVSHDLKTPLTSIVSYVDLLKKTDIQNAAARQYIDVLDRQSAKLKKLTEDLVEASKASSGVIKVNRTELNVAEILSQSVAEFSDRFEAAGITPVLNAGDTGLTISADGRLMWRVFENLLQNICKYAMPGTRAYIDVAGADGRAEITFKNVSAAPLNISADELMERFVRGDVSRHTEGSGLGLSIARSLMELQGGGFDLSLDGDLFKAIVTI